MYRLRRTKKRRGRTVYLDHNATTPLDPRVLKTMSAYLKESYGNASSSHAMGREARLALEAARERVAACIGARADEIVFTSGGTESDNLAIRGVARALAGEGSHIVTTSIEHHAVLGTCDGLERDGFEVTYVPVGPHGVADPDDVRGAIRTDTILISVMYANNETGVVQPLTEISAIARGAGVVLHTDAVQAMGKLPIDVRVLDADLVSVSAHKMYGPKGIGALYVRKGTRVLPCMTGGHHENGLRAGTEDVAGALALAQAMEIAVGAREEESERLGALRERLEMSVLESVDGVAVHGREASRVPNTSNMSFLSVDGEAVVAHLDLKGICAATGSACTTDSPEPSHVLLAMGVEPRQAQGAVRLSLGKGTTEEEIDYTVEVLTETVGQLRSISSV